MAWQWKMFIYLAARLARQWIKEQGIIVWCGVHIFSGLFGVAVDERSLKNTALIFIEIFVIVEPPMTPSIPHLHNTKT